MRLLTTLLIALLAGCSGPDEDVVRVRIWHQKIGAERVFFEDRVAAYNAAHRDREVQILYRETEELRNLFVVASVGGQGPDLVFGPSDNVAIYALTESILPIDEVLDEDYLAGFADAGVIRWEGEPWMVADQVGNHLAFVYNKRFIPEPPETTEELLDVLQRLQAEGTVKYGLTWNYTEPFFFIPFLTGFGGWVMDEAGNPTLDTEATARAIRFILDLRDRYGVIPRESDYNVAETLFKDEQAAAIINGPWAWAGYGEAGIDYGIARIPRVSETGAWAAPMVSSKGYSVNANLAPEKRPIVADVLRYLTDGAMQAEMARELATIPVIDTVRASGAVQDNPMLQASLRQVEVSRPMPTAPQMRQI